MRLDTLKVYFYSIHINSHRVLNILMRSIYNAHLKYVFFMIFKWIVYPCNGKLLVHSVALLSIKDVNLKHSSLEMSIAFPIEEEDRLIFLIFLRPKNIKNLSGHFKVSSNKIRRKLTCKLCAFMFRISSL